MIPILMCISCDMGYIKERSLSVRWHWSGPSNRSELLIILGRLGFSLGWNRVRPWLKPELTNSKGIMMRFSKGSDNPEVLKVPKVYTLMWGIFHFVWEGK